MDSFFFDASWMAIFTSPISDMVFGAFAFLVQAQSVLAILALTLWLWKAETADRLVSLLALVTFIGSVEGNFLPLFSSPSAYLPPGAWLPSPPCALMAALWTGLALDIRHWASTGLAIVMLAGTGLMRLYFGFDLPVAVFSGLSQGIALAFLMWSVFGRERSLWHSISCRQHAVFCLFGFAFVWGVWLNWPATPAPLAASAFLALAVGWWAGRSMDLNLQPAWHPPRQIWRRIAVGSAGLGLLFAFRAGLAEAAIAANLSLLLGLSGLGFLTGLIIASGLPALFRSLGLSESPSW